MLPSKTPYLVVFSRLLSHVGLVQTTTVGENTSTTYFVYNSVLHILPKEGVELAHPAAAPQTEVQHAAPKVRGVVTLACGILPC